MSVDGKRRIAIALALAFAGSACGGGSGYEPPGTGDEPTPSVPTARITPANAFEIAHVAVVLGRIASLPDLFVFVGHPPASGTPQTLDCTGGGAFVHGFELDEAPLGAISVGDRYFVDVQSCNESDAALDGELELEFHTVSGDVAGGTAFEFGAALAVHALAQSGSDGGRTLEAMLASNAAAQAGASAFVQSGSASSTREFDGAQHVHELHQLEVSTTVQTVEGGIEEQTYRFDAVFSCSGVPGMLTVETPFELVAFGTSYPQVGELLIRGGGGSSLRLVPLDAQVVELQIDADGDDTPEASAQILWSQL